MPPYRQSDEIAELLKLSREQNAAMLEMQSKLYSIEGHLAENKASMVEHNTRVDGRFNLLEHRTTGLETSRDSFVKAISGIGAALVTSTLTLWFRK